MDKKICTTENKINMISRKINLNTLRSIETNNKSDKRANTIRNLNRFSKEDWNDNSREESS